MFLMKRSSSLYGNLAITNNAKILMTAHAHVLTSDRWHKLSSAPSTRTPAVNKQIIMPATG